MIFKSINPYNQEIIAEYSTLNTAQIDAKLKLASSAYQHWRHTSFDYRAMLFEKIAQLLETRVEEYAKLITFEMGKVLTEAKAEVLKCGTVCRYYAQNAPQILQPKNIQTDNLNKILYQPTGAVFAIMPWNYPFWQVLRYSSAALMAGNVTLLKHAPNVTGCSLALEKLFLDAGFPEGVFQAIVVDIDATEHIIASDIVQGVTLTGSERAGSAVGALAGKYIKKSVLELGGSDPVLILDDADIDKAAASALASRLLNAGQTCISAKRLFVTDKNFDAFFDKVKMHFDTYTQGDPMLSQTKIGPLCRLDIAANLKSQLDRTLAQGAHLVAGGEVNGCNFEPALLSNVNHDMVVGVEETFGPLVSVFKVKDENQMIDFANNSPYGLAASIWSKDTEKAEKMAEKIESGSVFINSMVKSDARLPFGGIKRSGYGRELGHDGMIEFCNIKTVAIF